MANVIKTNARFNQIRFCPNIAHICYVVFSSLCAHMLMSNGNGDSANAAILSPICAAQC